MDVEFDDDFSDNEILNEFGTESESDSETQELFTDEQKYEHWLQVFNAIKFLENGGRITEDWMEDQKYQILRWRDWFSDFSNINPDIEDPAFRQRCVYAEGIMQQLVLMIRETKTFDPSVYLLLLKSIEYIRASVTSVDDITEWITYMCVSSD
jgi:hypothetical protein